MLSQQDSKCDPAQKRTGGGAVSASNHNQIICEQHGKQLAQAVGGWRGLTYLFCPQCLEEVQAATTGFCVIHGNYEGDCSQCASNPTSQCSCNPIDSYLGARAHAIGELQAALRAFESHDDARAIFQHMTACSGFVQLMVRLRGWHFDRITDHGKRP